MWNNSVVFLYFIDLIDMILWELIEIKICKSFMFKDGLCCVIFNKNKVGIIVGDEECYVLF